ncbi:MAG: hypothetical protein LIO86_06260 [Lachnospiraceae bacterium]|nr:hypothetical protein [Clostridiales bacterium]MCC8162761.1 hypothetical protein [Lachnospiraceae bacterium]
MKNYFRRLLAIALSLAMVFSTLPGTSTVWVSADEGEGVSAETETEELEVTGTDSVGTMIASAVSAVSEDTDEETGEEASGQITGITVTGTTATVEFQAVEDCDLVVAVYTEDGTQMVASGTTAVSSSDSSASVTLEGGRPGVFPRIGVSSGCGRT